MSTKSEHPIVLYRFGFKANFEDNSQRKKYLDVIDNPKNNVEKYYEGRKSEQSFYYRIILYAPINIIDEIKNSPYYIKDWEPKPTGSL